MAQTTQDTSAGDYVVSAPVHSRLPRLDLGIDWVPRWEEFRTSLRGALSGPKPDVNEAVSGGDDLRVEWVRSYRPRGSFLAAALCHAIAIWLITLPIWGFLPQTQAAAPLLEVHWDLGADLPPIFLPARAAEKSLTRPHADAAPKSKPQRGADAYNPHQTILSMAVRLTHPRQTLIEPDAPMNAPTIVQQLPNIVQWSVPTVQRPAIDYSISQSRPELRQIRRRTAVAPQIANNAKDSESLNLANASDMQLAPPAPVVSKAVIAQRRMPRHHSVAAPQILENANSATLLNVSDTSDLQLAPPAPVPSNSAVMARRRTVRQAAAPEIAEQTNGNPADVRKLIAISAAPTPPAPEAQIPKGNLAANVTISSDGEKPGNLIGMQHGGADSKTSRVSTNGDALPAAISVSGSITKAASGSSAAHPGNITPHLNLSMRPMKYPELGTPHAARTGPANVAALPPGALPEELLSGQVFTMHVSTPNTTSTWGSWTLSFAQLDDDTGVAARPNSALSGPEPIYTVDPRYPPDTVLEHIEGEVVLYAIIRKDGSVDSIQLVHSLDTRLDKAAMDALAQWKFRPGSRAGKPVDLETVIHVPFQYQRLRY